MTPAFGPGSLANLGVVLAGGSGGIGARIAAGFAQAGSRVVVLDLEPRATADLVDAIALDIADPESVQDAFAEAVRRLGGVDVVVNSAGIHHLAPLTETTVEDWRRINDVNALGTFLLTQQAGRHLIARGLGGRVINIASMAAKHGGACEVAYAASKAAVVAVSRAAALEWGVHDITVNAICPGYVPTEMGSDSRTEADIRRWSALSPLGRLGTPDDVAGLVLFLASPYGAYLTGQAFNVTGGMVMH